MNQIADIHAVDESGAPLAAMPHSIEAEQQLLGAILTNNEIYDRVSQIVKASHFYEPIHARIFDLCAARITKNTLASPVTMASFMENDEGLRELGGAEYLARLAASAIAAFAARDYAQMIYNLAIRRELINLGRDISARAGEVTVEEEPKDQITKAEQALYNLAVKGQSDKGFQSFLSAVTTAVDSANNAYKRDGGLAGISTGLVDMDKKLGGLHKSDLLILAGRPSMGKTALATNMAYNAASRYREIVDETTGHTITEGGKVLFFSLEMSAEQLAARMAEVVRESESAREARLTTASTAETTRTKRSNRISKTLDRSALLPMEAPATRCSWAKTRWTSCARQRQGNLTSPKSEFFQAR